MEIPQDILDAAHIKYPIEMCLKKTFGPDGVDANSQRRNDYIAGRMDERNGSLTFTVKLNSGLSWDDTITVSVIAKDREEALEIALAENPEYTNFNYFIR